MYPEAQDNIPLTLTKEDIEPIQKQLTHVGFTAIQARNATSAMSKACSLTSSLLANQTPLQACIEYLVLHVPECELPKRFLPDANSSNSFITSAHSGTDDLKRRWMQDKAVKQLGWPLQVVKECLSSKVDDNWPLLVKLLNKRLLGEDPSNVDDPFDMTGGPEELDLDELEALEVHITNSHELTIPSPMAPLKLVVLLNSNRCLGRTGEPPAMYIISSEVAAYVRLHVLSKILLAIKAGTFADSEENFIMAAMRHMEEEWVHIQDNGPPDMSTVLQHLLPRDTDITSDDDLKENIASSSGRGSVRRRRPRNLKDNRSDSAVKQEFDMARNGDMWLKMLATRKRLPAFKTASQFIELLASNRCVIVVGETGISLPCHLSVLADSIIQALERQPNVSVPDLTENFSCNTLPVCSAAVHTRLHDPKRPRLEGLHSNHSASSSLCSRSSCSSVFRAYGRRFCWLRHSRRK